MGTLVPTEAPSAEQVRAALNVLGKPLGSSVSTILATMQVDPTGRTATIRAPIPVADRSSISVRQRMATYLAEAPPAQPKPLGGMLLSFYGTLTSKTGHELAGMVSMTSRALEGLPMWAVEAAIDEWNSGRTTHVMGQPVNPGFPPTPAQLAWLARRPLDQARSEAFSLQRLLAAKVEAPPAEKMDPEEVKRIVDTAVAKVHARHAEVMLDEAERRSRGRPMEPLKDEPADVYARMEGGRMIYEAGPKRKEPPPVNDGEEEALTA